MENRFDGSWPPMPAVVTRNDIVASGACAECVDKFIERFDIQETSMSPEALKKLSRSNDYVMKAIGFSGSSNDSGYGFGYGYGSGYGSGYGFGSGYGYGYGYGDGDGHSHD